MKKQPNNNCVANFILTPATYPAAFGQLSQGFATTATQQPVLAPAPQREGEYGNNSHTFFSSLYILSSH